MNNENHNLENNIAKLIRSGFGPDVRPSPKTFENTYQRLASQVRAESAVVEFPVHVLGLLFGALMLMAAWLAAQIIVGGSWIISPLLAAVISAVLFLNLAAVPIAGIIIVTRRRYVQV